MDQGPTFEEHWGWFVTLDAISNNNPLLWDKILKKNVVWFLNVVSYYKDKAAHIEEMNKPRANNGE